MPPPDGFNVPLTHKICDFYKLFHKCLILFPKQEKYTLGQKIENTTLEILEFTLSATYLPKYKKTEIIKKASDKNDLLKYLVRLSYETKSINDKRYLTLETKAVEIGRMIGGWIKSTQ